MHVLDVDMARCGSCCYLGAKGESLVFGSSPERLSAKLTGAGAAAQVASAIAVNTTLHTIKLADNDITDQGAHRIGSVFFALMSRRVSI